MITAMFFYSVLLTLGSLSLFGSHNVPHGTLSLIFYCLALIGFMTLAVMVKKRKWLRTRFGVFKNKRLIDVTKILLNVSLIVMAILGPFFFLTGFAMAFGGNSPLFTFFGLACAGPLGAISGLIFLVFNIKNFKKPITWLALPLLLFLVLVNLYCFYPIYRYIEIFYNFNLDKLWKFVFGG